MTGKMLHALDQPVLHYNLLPCVSLDPMLESHGIAAGVVLPTRAAPVPNVGTKNAIIVCRDGHENEIKRYSGYHT